MGVRQRWEELAGGRQAFEEGVTMLLAMVYPGLRHVDGSGGDRGRTPSFDCREVGGMSSR